MKKTIVVLFVLFVLLLGFKIAKESNQESVRPLDTKIDLIEEELSSENLKQITVQHDGRLFILGHHDGVWRIQSLFNIEAQQDLVEKLIGNFNLLHGELRSSNPTLLKDYDIEAERAIRVSLHTKDEKVYSLLFGRKPNGGAGHFVRIGESEKVYAVDIDLLKAFGLTGDLNQARIEGQPWANTQVVDFDAASVQAITLDAEGERMLSIKRIGEEQWEHENDYAFPIDMKRIEGYLKTVTSQKGFYVEDVNNLDFSLMDWIVTFTMNDTSTVTLTRTAKTEENKFYLRQGDLPYAMQISVYHFDNFHKSDWDLFETNPLKFDKDVIDYVIVKGPGRRDMVTLYPDPIPEEEWVLEDEFGETIEPEKRRWKSEKGEAYQKNNADQVLSQIRNIRFEYLIDNQQKTKPYLTISFANEGEEQQDFVIGEDNGEGCYPLAFDDHEYGYCLTERSVAKIENAITALKENKE